MSDEIWSRLQAIDNVSVEINKDLTLLSTMKLKANGTLITVREIQALSNVMKLLNQFKIKPIMLGLGANQILPEIGKRPYLKLNFKYDKSIFDEARTEYTLPASLTLNTLTAHAQKFGLKGWEVFTGIPATIGGAIYMNAGTNLGEFGQIVKNVVVMQVDGTLKKVNISNNSFSYRKNHFVQAGEIIVEATLTHFGIDESIKGKISDYLNYRISTQPLWSKTCGCIFKNYNQLDETNNLLRICRAGLSVDLLGLKGLQFAGVKIGHKHANFLENVENATEDDVKNAISVILKELYLQYGIRFEPEVEFQKN